MDHNTSRTTRRHRGGGKYARRAVLLFAATAAMVLATSLGSAFADGYRAQTASNSGEFSH